MKQGYANAFARGNLMKDLYELREEARRLNDPIVIATVAANLLGKPEFSDEEKAKALNSAAELIWDARKIRVPPARGFSEKEWAEFDEMERLRNQKFPSFDDFVERLTSKISKITHKTRIGWVRKLCCRSQEAGGPGTVLDLKSPENWNELVVETFADEIAGLRRDELRKNKSRSVPKNSAKEKLKKVPGHV
jgi:hypothetical protein